ncbi:hypothetical protein TIFTF001_046927 [Ficus carica]|uniref:Uncharacterized protein n=1 Tax=Ficus carica TaxID=3494 RepID=A0AA87YNQ0_FICCA|nr:hypothetical protein TIFTF001_046927 [Ficus carica]
MLYTQLSPHLCCNGSQPLGNIPSGSLASTHRLRLFPNPLATFPSGEAVHPPPTDYNFSLTTGNHLLPLCPPTIPVTIFLSPHLRQPSEPLHPPTVPVTNPGFYSLCYLTLSLKTAIVAI